jgi:ankyrin repeat protein
MDDIWEAARGGDVGEVERLVGHDPSLLDAGDEDEEGQTPLMGASQKGHVGVVEWLLNRGAAIDKQDDDGCTALFFASWWGRAPVVALLLERGADPTIADRITSFP